LYPLIFIVAFPSSERRGRSVHAGDKIGIRYPAEFVHLFVDDRRTDVDSVSVLAKIG
jgi:hypothetical protein